MPSLKELINSDSLKSGGSYLSELADTITNLPTNLQRVITHPQIFNKIIGYNPMQRETGFAAAATGLPPKQEYAGGILNPPNLEYEKGYESGEPVAIAAGAAPFAIPIGRSAGKALAPKMYQMAEDYMVKTGGILPVVPIGKSKTTPMEIAQKNAALPVSEGGLGLPANNTQMQRAEAMGFNVKEPMYHGTKSDFFEFNLKKHGSATDKGDFGQAVYVSSDPDIANTYATGTSGYGIPKTDAEKAIYALTQTQKGGEAIVSAASKLDATASATVRNQVAKRAEDVLKITDELRADNVQAIVNQNLKSYTDEVKGFYKQVKEAPKEFTTDYSFDFDKLGIQPIVETIGAKIENPAIKQRFVNTLTKIEQASEGRTFNDLIDLRQAVNDIKFNGPNLKFSDAKTLDNAISAIDNEIDTAAKTHIPQYETWAKNWDTAKVEYAKMKDLESNILYKVLTKPGINEDTVVKAFTKYIGAGDNTFYQVMEKLPKNVQNRIEGSVLNNLTEKYAAGTLGGNRAIHFPLLSQELKKVSWQSPKTKQTVRTINRMAEVFKNDVNLARVSGGIEIPRFQSYLTTDPIVRLKFEVASKFFNHIKQFYPGDEANALALVKHASKLLENPISDKSLKDMMRTIPLERRKFREKLEFADDMEAIKQAYLERQMALKQMFNKDIPPRLVWKSNPDDLARLQNPEATILPSVDEVLYGTAKGTVGKNPSEVNLTDRASDLLTEFIWRNTSKENGENITEQAIKYMDDNRFTNIMTNVAKKLSKEDFEKNALTVANSIKSEAGILIKRIEKDFGVKMPKSEAEKLVALKFKEIMEQCNGK